jgi:PAS domain S-box-containing protein
MAAALERKTEPSSNHRGRTLESEVWEDDLVFLVDTDFAIRQLSNSLEIQPALPMEDAAESSARDALLREILHPLRPKFKSIFETGGRLSQEVKLKAGAREAWFDVRLTPTKDERGRVASILGISREITESKKKEELVSRSRREWLRAIDALPYAVASVDGRHRIMRINTAMARKIGISVRAAVGLICYKHLQGLRAPPSYCPLLEANRNIEGYRAYFTEKSDRGEWYATVRAVTDLDVMGCGCLYTARNADEGHEATSRFKKNRELMAEFLSDAEHAVLIQDRDGRYIFLNSIPGNGAPPNELIGMTPFDLFDPDEASRMLERVRTVAETGLELSEEREMRLGGRTFAFFDLISPINNSAGDVKEVVTVKRKISPDPPGRRPDAAGENFVHGLSERECEVLKLIAKGYTSRHIAEKLYVSKKTVETHRARIMQKLGLHKASALVSFAVKSGIV